MSKLFSAVAVLCLITAAGAEEPIVGSGEVVTASRDLGAFRAIDFRIPGDLEVTIGEQQPLTIKADENIAPLIKTEIKDGTLTISADKPFTTKHDPAVRITVPDLTALAIRGSGDARVRGLDNKTLAVSAAGSADVRLSGKTKSLTLTLDGSADADAFALAAQQAVVTINGSADAKVDVATSLVATVQGSGDLTYTGSPHVVSTVHGSGTVQKKKS